MANNLDRGHRSRPLIGLVASVLLLGTLLAWWGTRDHRRQFGEAVREPIAAGVMILPPARQQDSALLDRGYQISQRQCAGCHEMTARSSAPSYEQIVTFYRREFPAAGDSDLQSRLASAVAHPQPGWGNFAPGPPESELSPEDRVALASWMLNGFVQARNAGEGVHK